MKPDELADHLLEWDPDDRGSIDIEGRLARDVRAKILADMDSWATKLGLTLSISEDRSFWYSDVIGAVQGDVISLQTFARMLADRLAALKHRREPGPGFMGWALPCYLTGYVAWRAAEHDPGTWLLAILVVVIWGLHISRASRDSQRPEAPDA